MLSHAVSVNNFQDYAAHPEAQTRQISSPFSLFGFGLPVVMVGDKRIPTYPPGGTGFCHYGRDTCLEVYIGEELLGICFVSLHALDHFACGAFPLQRMPPVHLAPEGSSKELGNTLHIVYILHIYIYLFFIFLYNPTNLSVNAKETFAGGLALSRVG